MNRGKLLLEHVYNKLITRDEFNYLQKNIENLYERTGMPDIFKHRRNFEDFKMDEKNQMEAKWDYLFTPKLTEILKEKSTGEFWEVDKLPEQKIWVENDSKRLLDKIFYNLKILRVYEYGKQGVEITFSPLAFPNDENIKVKALPACEEFFFRDWKHDGICAKSTDMFVKQTFDIVSPASVKRGDVEESGWIDTTGIQIDTTDKVAKYLTDEDVSQFSGCPPGNWYETGYITNPDDESEERRSFHIYNASRQQEIDVFKKIFPKEWKERCQ